MLPSSSSVSSVRRGGGFCGTADTAPAAHGNSRDRIGAAIVTAVREHTDVTEMNLPRPTSRASFGDSCETGCFYIVNAARRLSHFGQPRHTCADRDAVAPGERRSDLES